jgi:hypothetical protein
VGFVRVHSRFLVACLVAAVVCCGSAATAYADGPPAGMVAAYGFEEGSGSSIVDSSGNGNLGTISGAVRTASGKYGNGLSFDGTDDIVDVPDSNSLDVTAGITLSAWVKPDGIYSRWQEILYKRDGTQTRAYELSADSTAGKPTMVLNNGVSLPGFSSPTALLAGQWVHVAGTWNGSTAKLYIDGVLVKTGTLAGPLIASTGVLRLGGVPNNRFFDGVMDEVRIYDRALPQTEIQDDMAISVFDQTTDLPLNEELPTVSGVTVDGELLSATAGTWSGTGPLDYAYQWRRCDEEGENCEDISGATDSTFELTPAEVDHTVRVVVTAEGPGGEVDAASAPTALVSGFTATIAGTARRSEALRAEAGTWRGSGSVSYDYQWQRCDENGEDCDDIDGARRLTYSLKAEDIGHTIRVKIAAGPETALTRSAATAVVVERLASRAVDPPIYGHAAVGETVGTASGGFQDAVIGDLAGARDGRGTGRPVNAPWSPGRARWRVAYRRLAAAQHR